MNYTTPLNRTDFYKADHRNQYPAGTTQVFSNWTARSSRIADIDHVVFFGLQAYLADMRREWDAEFFDRPLESVLAHYMATMKRAGLDITYEHIAELHALGYLPLEVWALPEGTHVPIGVPMFVMWNTVPEFFWLTNYIETSLSANLWGPCTAATLAARLHTELDWWGRLTGAEEGSAEWQAHDFSYRGMYGDHAAALSGAGHLLSFKGTDCIPALDFLRIYYGGEDLGGSVAATEHSVMCMGGKDGEEATYRRLLTEVYPAGIVSVVSDTWDLWKVMQETLPALKAEIMARPGKLVIRPDSGDPVKIMTGDDDAPKGSPERAGVIQLLWDEFGGAFNPAGYRVLDEHVGAIYGDSITWERANQIMARLSLKGFCSTSATLGVGSFTYQHVTRDTFGFALKATAGVVNGEPREIFKDPATDDGTKKSLKGYVAAYRGMGGRLYAVDGVGLDRVRDCAFRPVFKDGFPLNPCTVEAIRERVRDGA